ncbi:MAG: internalin [Blastocatellia bacterium]
MADEQKILKLIERAAKEGWTKLDLRDNQLRSLPPAITKLTNLTSIDLGNNQLTSLPPEITKLTNLTSLRLGFNQLTSVPLEITKLINLTHLNLSYNHLMSVPPEITKLSNLTSLRLGSNHLKSLPLEITKLTNLTTLNLSDNLLPIPPETLANPQDVKAIFAAIAGLKSGERLNEAKMLVVGDGKVGKSSVVEQLIYGTFNPQKQTTLGVEINDEMKVVQSEVKGEGEPVKLNIWDFGGQEIQHSTHQFFLTTRSLYLLVVDARKGDQISNIEYWLKLIESFGGASPIIVVINQIDQLKGQRPLNLDRKALQEKYNIKDFVETSCPTGEGIPALKATIACEIEQMKHVHDIWPREWLAIKRRLKEMHADYIPVEKYLEICGEEKLKDEDLRQSLLDILHVLGTVIRFPGDTQVLNPRWVTQGVYGLLTSAQLVKAQGQFDLKDVGEILAGLPDAQRRYPSHTHRRLIDVMKHFQLCFEFTDRQGHYLIPRHLHDNELDIPWDDADALKFQYHYVETLPDSVISRFIVRMNQYITKQYYWKNGVFLHSGENRAKIKADLVDRKIFISIIGKEQTRRAFLAVIRSAFDEINSNFKIEIKQMIPVPGFPHVLVSYKELLVHEEMGEQEIVIPELRKKFPVRELIDGVEELRARLARRERDLNEGRYLPRMPEEIQPKSQPPAPPSKNNPASSLMSFVLGFVIVLAAIVGAAVAISRWVSVTAGVMTGVIIVGALLAIGVAGAMQLRNDDRLSEDNFLKLMIESYKRLPLLRGNGESNNQPEE